MIIGYAIPAVQKFQGAAYKSLYYQALEISKADGATPDENPCLLARGDELYRAGVGAVPSVLIVPQFVKPGAVYTQIPTPTLEGGDFDQFTFTRATTATRVNASGLIESVASGVLRLDYPIGGGCPAALIEPAATNFARWVNEMTGQNVPAASGGMTITTGSTDFLAPDGTSGSITKYVGGNASGVSQQAYYTGGITVTASGAHTFSMFVKRGETNPLTFCALQFALYTGGSGTANSYFNLESGTALTAGASIQDYGNGWYRLISAPYTIASGDLSGNLIFSMAEADNDINWPASGALGLTAYTWGAQFETGAIPTSYIPTTTASATRNADVCSVSGVSGYIGQTEGTIYAEVDFSRIGKVAARVLELTDDTINNRILIAFGSDTTIITRLTTATVEQASFIATVSFGILKIAFAYSSAGCVLFVNGINAASNLSATIPLCNKINIGSTFANSSQLNDRIRAAAIYTTRLSNDQLASLTRLT